MLWDALGDGPENWRVISDLSEDLRTFPDHMMSFPLDMSYKALDVDGCTSAAADDDGDDGGSRVAPPLAPQQRATIRASPSEGSGGSSIERRRSDDNPRC